MRVAPQRLLHLQRQPVHALPHVGAADRQPHPLARGDRDHRCANAATTAAAKAGDTEVGIRTRAFPANSISIADIGGSAVVPLSTGAIINPNYGYASRRWLVSEMEGLPGLKA
jgi:hypothetical protein